MLMQLRSTRGRGHGITSMVAEQQLQRSRVGLVLVVRLSRTLQAVWSLQHGFNQAGKFILTELQKEHRRYWISRRREEQEDSQSGGWGHGLLVWD